MVDVIVEAKIDEATRGLIQNMLNKAVAQALMRAQSEILKYARDITPVDTGRLRDSFKVFVSGKVIHMLWSTEYARIADEGAEPHVIHARAGGWLKFWWKKMGIPMRIKTVQHPGYTGHFFSDQMRIVAPQFVREAIIREMQAGL